jgi:hypothetical protein
MDNDDSIHREGEKTDKDKKKENRLLCTHKL